MFSVLLWLGRAVTEVCILGMDGWLHEVNGDLEMCI